MYTKDNINNIKLRFNDETYNFISKCKQTAFGLCPIKILEGNIFLMRTMV